MQQRGSKYDQKFKEEALALVASGVSITNAAFRLGIPKSTLSDWVNTQYECDEDGAAARREVRRAQIRRCNRIVDKTLRAVGGPQTRTAAPAARPEAAPRKQEGSGQLRLEGRVLSGRHVQGCPPHSTLWVPRETLITQLAADEARRRDICIRKET